MTVIEQQQATEAFLTDVFYMAELVMNCVVEHDYNSGAVLRPTYESPMQFKRQFFSLAERYGDMKIIMPEIHKLAQLKFLEYKKQSLEAEIAELRKSK